MILVFGQTGQVARELARADGVRCLSRQDADLSDPDACAAAVRTHRPTAVINAAAFTAVDDAEAHADLAHVINAAAPGAMARAAAELGVPMVQISTDYVFDGSGTQPHRPEDPVAPLGVYGASKVAGEGAVRAAGGVHAILRTSWVVSAHGKNFVKTMLALGASRDSLRIVEDQIGGPTPAGDIATACLTIARELIQNAAQTGTYHISGAPDVSWADFAAAIFAAADLTCEIIPIPTADYPTTAARPLNSRLNCDTLLGVFGINRPDWRDGLESILTDLEGAPA